MSFYNGVFYTDSDPLNNDKPVIVFLHGFFMNSDMFKHQVAALHTKYRVICCDIRGFGKTLWNAAPYSLYDIVNDVISITEHLNLRRFVLGGMSMGGYIALRLAITHQKKVDGLILLATQANQDNFETIDSYCVLRDNWNNLSLREEMVGNLAPVIIGTDEDETSFWKNVWLQYPPEAIYHAMNAMLERDSIEHELNMLKIPTIVIHGSDDQGIPLTYGEQLSQKIQGAKMVVVKGACHAVNLTHPVQTNAAIASFLDEIY